MFKVSKGHFFERTELRDAVFCPKDKKLFADTFLERTGLQVNGAQIVILDYIDLCVTLTHQRM